MFLKRSHKALGCSPQWKTVGPSTASSLHLCPQGQQGSKGSGLGIAVTCQSRAQQTSFFSALPTDASLHFSHGCRLPLRQACWHADVWCGHGEDVSHGILAGCPE